MPNGTATAGEWADARSFQIKVGFGLRRSWRAQQTPLSKRGTAETTWQSRLASHRQLRSSRLSTPLCQLAWNRELCFPCFLRCFWLDRSISGPGCFQSLRCNAHARFAPLGLECGRYGSGHCRNWISSKSSSMTGACSIVGWKIWLLACASLEFLDEAFDLTVHPRKSSGFYVGEPQHDPTHYWSGLP